MEQEALICPGQPVLGKVRDCLEQGCSDAVVQVPCRQPFRTASAKADSHVAGEVGLDCAVAVHPAGYSTRPARR